MNEIFVAIFECYLDLSQLLSLFRDFGKKSLETLNWHVLDERIEIALSIFFFILLSDDSDSNSLWGVSDSA